MTRPIAGVGSAWRLAGLRLRTSLSPKSTAHRPSVLEADSTMPTRPLYSVRFRLCSLTRVRGCSAMAIEYREYRRRRELLGHSSSCRCCGFYHLVWQDAYVLALRVALSIICNTHARSPPKRHKGQKLAGRGLCDGAACSASRTWVADHVAEWFSPSGALCSTR